MSYRDADLLAIYVSYITCKSEPLTVGFGNKIREDLEVYGVFLVIKFLEAMREQLWSSKKKKCTRVSKQVQILALSHAVN